MNNANKQETIEMLKIRNIQRLDNSKIKDIQSNLLDKDGYCSIILGKWIVYYFKDIINEHGYNISNSKDLSYYINCLNLSNNSNVEEFFTKYEKNHFSADYNFSRKCLNVWEQFISDEYPEFNYNKDTDDMDYYLYSHFMDENCHDSFIENFFYEKKLKEILNYYENYNTNLEITY